MSEPCPEPPDHAFELVISVGGETWPRTVAELQRLTDHVAKHGPECNLVSGGGGCAEVRIRRRDVTPENYQRELAAWVDAYHAWKGDT